MVGVVKIEQQKKKTNNRNSEKSEVGDIIVR